MSTIAEDTPLASLMSLGEKHGSGYGLAADMLISTFIWSMIQVFFFQVPDLSSYKLERNSYLDLRNRFVSFIHGNVALLLTGYQIIFVPSACGDSNTNTEHFILCMTGGYFTYDFLSMAYFGLLDFDMCFHHLMCIFGIVDTLSSE